MKTNLIVLTKEKLLSIDIILPILLELKSRYPKINIIFFFPSKSNCDLVKKNLHLWECIQSLDAEVLAPKRDNKILILCFLIRFFVKLIFCENIVIKFGDTLFKHKQFIECLKKFSKTVEIRALIPIPVVDFQDKLACLWGLHPDNNNRTESLFGEVLTKDTDYLLTSMRMNDLNSYYQKDIPEKQYIYTGYARRLPKWTEFIDKAMMSYQPIQEKKYFLYVLTTMGPRTDFLDEPLMSGLVKETLTQLKQFNSEIYTIFKPHPLTDLDILGKIINEIGYTNFAIDYGHPTILSSKAEFVIGNTFSNTMYDAFYKKIPIIEYCSYDRRFLTLLDNGSRGGKCCDFFIDRDPSELKGTVHSLLNGNSPVKREQAFIDLNFPKTPDSFFEIFDRLMKN